MARARVAAGGGWPAIFYVFRKGREAGGIWKLYQRLRSKNACKTCALGMGGQAGGMVNEKGHFPEVCKKSVQAQAGDMNGVIAEDFFQKNSIAGLQSLSSREFENLGRLTFPIMAEPGDTHFRRISWREALSKTTAAFRGTSPHEVFFYSSGRSSNEAAYLLQLIGRVFGTANIHNCSFYCHQASGVALNKIYGSGTSSIALDDLDQADLALVVGANPASNHPRLLTKLMQLRRRGGQVIIINPLRELGLVRFRVPSDWRSMLFGTQISDLYLQPHIGTDIEVFLAILKRLIEKNALDEEFIARCTTGWNELRAAVEREDLGNLLKRCGLPLEQIDQAVNILSRSKRGIFLWAMGLTHHQHGVDNILALGNIALARGWLGRPGCGLLPIRGHSNVQGVGSVGVTPALKKAFRERMAQIYGLEIPEHEGLDTHASMVAAHAGRIKAALLLGGNLFASNPDREWAAQSMQRIDVTFSLTTKLNEGHVWGRGKTAIVVPVLARDEESQATSQESMFNFVRLSDGGSPCVEGEMRSEVDILAELAEGILPAPKAGRAFDWKALRSHERLRQEMARVVPGFEKIAVLGTTKQEFQLPGRVLHDLKFPTEDGKAHFHVTPVPDFSVPAGEFRLTTLRSEGQFNTVVYDEEDLYRGNSRRDVVMMAADDVRRLNLSEGAMVRVETTAGKMVVAVAVTDLPPGNLAMYYPEANILVPQKLDERSKTPAFKSIAARVRVLQEPAARA